MALSILAALVLGVVALRRISALRRRLDSVESEVERLERLTSRMRGEIDSLRGETKGATAHENAPPGSEPHFGFKATAPSVTAPASESAPPVSSATHSATTAPAPTSTGAMPPVFRPEDFFAVPALRATPRAGESMRATLEEVRAAAGLSPPKPPSPAMANSVEGVDGVGRVDGVDGAPPPFTSSHPSPDSPPREPDDLDAAVARVRERISRALFPKNASGDDMDFETRLGVVWFNRLGLLLLAIGLAYLAKLATPLLQPWHKTALAYAMAMGVAWTGRALESRLRRFGRPVLAGGLALGFYVSFAAGFVPAMKCVPIEVALVWMAGGILSILWMAEQRRSQRIAMLAVFLGHAAALVSADESGLWSLASVLFLSAGSIVLFVRHRWAALSLFALVAAYGSHFAWLFLQDSNATPEVAFKFNAVFLASYYVIFAAGDLARRVRMHRGSGLEEGASETLEQALGVGNLVLYAISMALVFVGTRTYLPDIHLFLLPFAALQLAMGEAQRRLGNRDWSLYPALAAPLATLGVMSALRDLDLDLILAGEALALLLAGRRARVWFLAALADLVMIAGFVYWARETGAGVPLARASSSLLGGLMIATVYLTKARFEELGPPAGKGLGADGSITALLARLHDEAKRALAPVLAPGYALAGAIVIARETWLAFPDASGLVVLATFAAAIIGFAMQLRSPILAFASAAVQVAIMVVAWGAGSSVRSGIDARWASMTANLIVLAVALAWRWSREREGPGSSENPLENPSDRASAIGASGVVARPEFGPGFDGAMIALAMATQLAFLVRWPQFELVLLLPWIGACALVWAREDVTAAGDRRDEAAWRKLVARLDAEDSGRGFPPGEGAGGRSAPAFARLVARPVLGVHVATATLAFAVLVAVKNPADAGLALGVLAVAGAAVAGARRNLAFLLSSCGLLAAAHLQSHLRIVEFATQGFLALLALTTASAWIGDYILARIRGRSGPDRPDASHPADLAAALAWIPVVAGLARVFVEVAPLPWAGPCLALAGFAIHLSTLARARTPGTAPPSEPPAELRAGRPVAVLTVALAAPALLLAQAIDATTRRMLPGGTLDFGADLVPGALAVLALGLAHERLLALRGGFGHGDAGRDAERAASWALTLLPLILAMRSIRLSPALGRELTTASWAILGVCLLAYGFAARASAARRCALGVLALAVARVFLLDVPGLEPVWRVGAFLCLGLCLLGAAWIYSRFSDRIRKWL